MTFPSRIAKISAPLVLLLPGGLLAQDAGPGWEFYGHLNFGVINVDDGFDTETDFVDSDASNSRIGLIYRHDLQNGGQFRFHFETSLGFTGSSAINRNDNDFDVNYKKTELRKFEFIYETKDIGTFFIGQGSMASDGSTGADFSGTGLIATSSVADVAGGQEFRLSNAAGSGITVGNAFSDLDGGRRFRVRYDTPRHNGFTFMVAAGEEVLRDGDDEEYYDIGVRYDRDFGDVKFAGRLGYSWVANDEELLVGSAAMLHESTGLSFALVGGQQQDGDDSYFYTKIGLQRDWLSVGRTHLSIDYLDGEDYHVTGSDSSSVGISVVQKLDAHNVELYASYRTFDFDAPGSQFEDLDVTIIGARWQF